MSSLKFDEKVFEKLAQILSNNDLTEIEYNEGDTKIRIVRQIKTDVVYQATQPQPQIQPITNTQQISEQHSHTKNDYSNHPGAVKSKIVGTCYLAPEPGAENFVKIGDSVQEGQPLLIIEAMKVMNLIKAPKSGKIIYIAVKDAEPVEYSQLLLVIE